MRAQVLKLALGSKVAYHAATGDPGARLITPRGRAMPYPIHHQVRRRGKVVDTLLGAMTADHAVVTSVLRDHERFGSRPEPSVRPQTSFDWLLTRIAAAETGTAPRRRRESAIPEGIDLPDPLGPESMIGMNPPEHSRVRRLVARAFTPRAIEQVRDRVEEVAGELLDGAPPGGFDLMTEYAGVLPVVVISELLGVPTDDRVRMKQWGDTLASSLDVFGKADPAAVIAALAGFVEYFTALFAERRRNPGDRVIDTLLAGGSDQLTGRELMATALLLLAAGFETTVNLIGNGTLALLGNRAAREALIDDPSLAANAVEETLRWDSPVQLSSRVAREDTTVAGHRLLRGDQIVVLMAGANRDPAVFDDPDRFDIHRSNAREHLSFAAGVHYCIGAPLARLEGEVALRALFGRYPGLRLAGMPTRASGLILRGPSSVPVRLGPLR